MARIRKGLVESFSGECGSKRFLATLYLDHGKKMDPHLHQNYEIIINRSPIAIRHTANGQLIETTTPCIVYRAPYVLHSSNTLGDDLYERWQVAFHADVLTEFGGICSLGRLADHQACAIPVDTETIALLEPYLYKLAQAQSEQLPKSVWISALSLLLHEISELLPSAPAASSAMPVYLQELVQYIVEHIEETLSVDDLAKRFYISRAKLMRDFRASTRYTVYEFITAIRLARAKVWLKEDMPLPIIAEKCGFAREASFIYMFRRETGMTPGEYRKRERKKQNAGNA